MPGSRRLSQRISGGDGIAIIARVRDGDAARVAEEQGATALAVDGEVAGIRELTTLPLLWLGIGEPTDADAFAMRPGDDADHDHLEAVLRVKDEDELEAALENHDPEIFMLSSDDEDDDDALEAVLDLLPDVPAGKLAIADVDVATRDEVVALERAGFDAVLAPAGLLPALVAAGPPDV